MKKSILISGILCIWMLISLPLKLRAQTEIPDLLELSLEELLNISVVTASKMEQKAGSAPASMIVVTEEEITIRGYQSLLDVLKDLPDFKVDDMVSSSTRNNITVRGVPGQEKFIIMLDGVRISSPTNEALPIMENYPVNLAQQIEIVYGPASALYGADAVSGIINIITKKNTDKALNVKASSLAGMYGLTNNSLYVSNRLAEDATITLSGQYMYDQQPDLSKVYAGDPAFAMDSHKTGNFNSVFGPIKANPPVTAAYEAPLKAYNMYVALRFKDFTLAGFRNYSQMSSSLEYTTDNAVYNKEALFGRSVTMANASYTKSIGQVTLSSLIMGSQYATDPTSNFRNTYSNMAPAYKFDVGTMLKAEQQVNWSVSDKLSYIGGATYESFKSIPKGGDLERPVNMDGAIEGVYLNSRSPLKPQGIEARFYNLLYNNLGVYSQLTYAPVTKASFTLGARFDNNSRFGKTFNPRIGIVYKPFARTTVKALYNSAFLAPSPLIAFQHYGTFYTEDEGQTYKSFFWHLPNPSLKPIRSKNLEFSISQFVTSDFSVTATAYVTMLKDLIRNDADAANGNIYNGRFMGWVVNYIETSVNQGKQLNYGGTLQLNHSVSLGKAKVKSYASFSYVDGEAEYFTDQAVSAGNARKVEIEFIAPVHVRLGSDITINKFSISPRLIMVGKQRISGFVGEDYASARQTIQGYTLLNVAARYRLGKSFAVFCNVENALDQRYRNVGEFMDLKAENTPHFDGKPQNPLRVMGGISFTL